MFRHPARIFAPLSLVACAIAVLMIVNHNSNSGGGSTAPATTATTTTAVKRSPKSHKRIYLVKSGDTLSAIALKTGVSLATLQQLNPTVDAQSLHAGQKLKLER